MKKRPGGLAKYLDPDRKQSRNTDFNVTVIPKRNKLSRQLFGRVTPPPGIESRLRHVCLGILEEWRGLWSSLSIIGNFYFQFPIKYCFNKKAFEIKNTKLLKLKFRQVSLFPGRLFLGRIMKKSPAETPLFILFVNKTSYIVNKKCKCNQGFGSVFIFSGSGSGSRGWGWRPIRIRIQSGSRALMTKNWKKMTAEKKIKFFFDQKLQFTYP